MSALVRSSAVILLLALASEASAHPWGWGFHRARASYYYAPVAAAPVYAPVYYAPPAPTYVPYTPSSCQPPLVYASPTPAPPSAAPAVTPSTTPPPMIPAPATSKPTPRVLENGGSRSNYFDAYAVAARPSETSTGSRCPVGFWNLTDRDVTLLVDGRSHALAAGKRLTLDLPREFRWQVDGREADGRRVAPAEAGLEIVLRR